MRRNKQIKLSKQHALDEVTADSSSMDSFTHSGDTQFKMMANISIDASKFVIDMKEITIDERIGKGAFATVYKGVKNNIFT